MQDPHKLKVGALCALTGVLIAAAIPPWGWWPTVFFGFAILDRLLSNTTRWQRFQRGWLVSAWWLFPAMLWMFDLTTPGYLIAGVLYSTYFGIASALTPPDGPWKAIVLPGAVALAEVARWYWPFGGVPLANIALGQANSPLAATARLAGPLLIVMLVVMIGQAINALASWAFARTTRARGADKPNLASQNLQKHVLLAGAVLAISLGLAGVHPRAAVVRDIKVAAVQGGGPTRTRASSSEQPIVLARHIEATRTLEDDVDLILWPENVVNPGRFLDIKVARTRVAQVAVEQNATLLAGWFYPTPDNLNTVNYQSAVDPTGAEIGRYDKVQIVPFGEYVPARSLIEAFSSEIPSRDVLRGTGPPVLATPVGPIGVAISWEAFFERRSRDAIANGAQLLTNPTNGSSFWLTQVHTQQVASNQLAAIANDRWLVMAGPTGLSAIINADGEVLARSDIGERRVLVGPVEMRTGRTLSSRVGIWPVVAYSLCAIILGLWFTRRDRTKACRQPSQKPSLKDQE